MSKLHYSAGAASITMDDTMDKIFRRAVENVQPGVVKILESEIATLGAHADGKWPVKTGKSKALLAYGVRLLGMDHIEAFIANSADYAFYIKGKNLGGKSAFQTLLRKPGLRLAPHLADLLADNAARALTED
tara:strand:+ start:140 stop:535 length:396 start_codon:yes stop_codon:yes gene_type:complete